MNGLQTHTYRDGTTALTGWVARPDGQPRGAIVVYPTIANIGECVAGRAALLAQAGFLVLVADFYGAAPEDSLDIHEQARELRADTAIYRRRLVAAIEATQALPEADGLPVGAIGFCMGGQAVLEIAREGVNLAAVISLHGVLDSTSPAKQGDTIHPRILICHGDKDPLVPREQVFGFMQEMDAVDADWHLHIYSKAKHGFTDPASDLRQLDAVAYDASADRQSWAATLNFLDEIFPLEKAV
ncbi:dienelactone hydrolase [Croceicoccus estronivorus]|uniref:dienelactone hydrolase family protein n=1 Tax=Croceicoccus estronivorus TaxID=1172626 RepID=UPI00082A44BA|nr:dienelactone hydrolase family protein [Croceicoccus estronivorus]OCC24572.1 dienelactone hydrolase [Croceicoccus estronivorus]